MRNIFAILLLCGFMSAAELKECQSDADTISGCVEKEYHDNGNLKSEVPLKNGKIEGVAKSYYENGNPFFEFPYKNGKIEGIVRFYREEDGSLWLQLTFSDGKAISGKCGDGKNLTDANLDSINQGSNGIALDFAICGSQ